MNLYDIYTGRKKKIPQTLKLTVKCGGLGEAVNLKSGLIKVLREMGYTPKSFKITLDKGSK